MRGETKGREERVSVIGERERLVVERGRECLGTMYISIQYTCNKRLVLSQ